MALMLVPLLVALVTFVVAARLLGRRRPTDPAKLVAGLVEPRRTRRQAAPELSGGLLRRRVTASEPLLARLPGWRRLAPLLDRAGVATAPAQVFWSVGAGLFLLDLLAAAAGAATAGVIALDVVLLAGLRLWLGLRVTRRRHAFDAQLPDLLTDLASALRAGHGFLQALQAVADDAPAPIGPELQRVLAEARLGRPLEDALLDSGRRVGSDDYDFVLDAVVVQRQVGGSLAGIFEIVGESVRSRQQFALKVRALTAMGRMSALVLLALPLAMAGGLSLLNPGYFAPLVGTGLGRMLLVGSVGLLGVGMVWLRQIAGGVR